MSKLVTAGSVMDDPSAASARGPSLPVLQRVALAANSSLDVDEVLERLATLTLEAIPGDRCAIFLLDSEKKLSPRMAVGRIHNETEWQHFLRSEPIDLTDGGRLEVLAAGRAIYLPDLAATPLVPKEFIESFGARRAIIKPLVAAGDALGVLSVDWTTCDYECSAADVSLVDAIGTYVSLAIRNSRLFESLATKARTLERLVGIAGALNSCSSLSSVLELICSAFADLLGTAACSIELVDTGEPNLIRSVPTNAPDELPSGDRSKTSLEETATGFDRLSEIWKRDGKPLIYAGTSRNHVPRHVRGLDAAGSVVLFPLNRSEQLLGYVVASFPSPERPSDESLATGQALAELAATATSRANLHRELQWRLQRVEVLHRLSDVVAGSAELAPALRRLNEVLPGELGVKLVSVSLADTRLREAIGARAPSDEDLDAIRSWRAIMAKRSMAPTPRETSGGLLVPIAHRKRVLGVLKVAIDPHRSQAVHHDLLLTIASGCAEVVHKAALHRELAESERRLAVVAERERIARDLHDSVGQVLTGLGMQLVDYAGEASDPVWCARLGELRDLAARGSREMRDAIQSLLFLQVGREGLCRSLRDLARKFEKTTGIVVNFRVVGHVMSIATVAEDALFRVAYEALINVDRHARASSVSLTMSYAADSVTVVVVDDGIGLGGSDALAHSQLHFGLVGLQRLLEEAGGALEVWDVVPNGVRLEGRIPVRDRIAGGRH